ncbi:hypothetical protein ACK12G_29355 [Mycolicibacterium wolinskyi]|uniref:hypothetical protein n=1 Tax=Mycolicibacterium wolinskyi TaxID=59750 RepID=UPI0039178E18
MSGPGDVVNPYVAESAREEAEALREMSAQLQDWLYDAKQRIDATNAVRSAVVDFDHPNLDDAVGAAAELNRTIEAIDQLADIFEAAADKLEKENADAANDTD